MTALLTGGGLVIGVLIGLAAPYARRRHRRSPQVASTRQILLPFTATTLSQRALEAAIRLAKVDGATLMPAFLATVPLSLSLESPLPNQSRIGMPLLEAIEQRATADGVPIDSRVQPGRSYRHALARLLEREQFDRVIISAADNPRTGLSGRDLLWILEHANAEVLILRAAPQDTDTLTTTDIKGHF
jgi:nucleotide-binding universal stress UspA family protein